MIYHMSKEVARNRADTMPALPAVVNAAVAAKYDRADRADADDDRGGADADYIYLASMQLSPPWILIASSYLKFYKIVKHGDENDLDDDDDDDRHHQEDGVLQSKEEERQLRRWRP